MKVNQKLLELLNKKKSATKVFALHFVVAVVAAKLY